ncbi:MAG: WbqC family protein [Endomicrobiales bacterium]|jgi:hypothetical protein
MIVSVHQPHYLPWLGYIDKIKQSDCFVFLDNVQYKKREFQNRNKIRTSTGWMWLTVPVLTKDNFHQKFDDVKIDNETNWMHDHWKSIEHNYARAPHFSQWRERIEPLYTTSWNKLIDINIAMIKLLLEAYFISTPVIMESSLGITTTSTQRIVDICKKLGADTYLSGTGAKDYMDESLFAGSGLQLQYQHFEHPVYDQVFNGFEPNMSIIDHLFNCGTTGS